MASGEYGDLNSVLFEAVQGGLCSEEGKKNSSDKSDPASSGHSNSHSVSVGTLTDRNHSPSQSHTDLQHTVMQRDEITQESLTQSIPIRFYLFTHCMSFQLQLCKGSNCVLCPVLSMSVHRIHSTQERWRNTALPPVPGHSSAFCSEEHY